MLRIRKRDWFPIVATDLFTGVLAAVIILDAVSPKEAAPARGTTAFVTLEYAKAAGKDCNDPTALVFAFTVAGQRHTTLNGATPLTTTESTRCVQRFLVENVPPGERVHDAMVVVAEYPGTPQKVTVRGSHFPTLRFRCDSGDSACVLVR